MRTAAVLLALLLAGCSGAGGAAPPLPHDFTITQPATAGTPVDASYTIDSKGATHLNATLVWGTAGNQFDLDLTAGGSAVQQGASTGTVAHLEANLQSATYLLKVSGTPAAGDTWHLEVHFTRA